MKKKLIKIIIFIIVFFQILQVNAGLQELESQLNPGIGAFLKTYVIKNLNNITFLNNIIKVIESDINKYSPKDRVALNYFKLLIESYLNNSGGVSSLGGTTNGTVKIAIMGDQNEANTPTLESFKLVKNEGAELIIHNGDFLNDGDSWDKIVTNTLGPNFPVVAVMGNHDVDWLGVKNSWGNFQRILKRRINASSLRCNGEIGKKTVCIFKGIKIISVSPGINSGDYAGFIINNLQNDKSIWRLCHWHKNMAEMQLGDKGSVTGWGVYEAARQTGCISINGHDHSYGRTYLLDNMKTQHIINHSKNGPYLIKPGQIIHLLVGSSGMGLYGPYNKVYNLPHWAIKYTKDDGLKGKGVLFCTFKGRKADCYFKSVSGQITDRFSLISGN